MRRAPFFLLTWSFFAHVDQRQANVGKAGFCVKTSLLISFEFNVCLSITAWTILMLAVYTS